MKFKVGDTVVVNGNTCFKDGTEGLIFEADSGCISDLPYFVKQLDSTNEAWCKEEELKLIERHSMKFKVGDRVRIIDERSDYYYTEATIEEVDVYCPDGLYYKVKFIDNFEDWKREKDLEFILDNREIKSGDTVEVVECPHTPTGYKGVVQTVELGEENYYFVRLLNTDKLKKGIISPTWFKEGQIKLAQPEDQLDDNSIHTEDTNEITPEDQEQFYNYLHKKGFKPRRLEDSSGSIVDYYATEVNNHEISIELDSAKGFQGNWNYIVEVTLDFETLRLVGRDYRDMINTLIKLITYIK